MKNIQVWIFLSIFSGFRTNIEIQIPVARCESNVTEEHSRQISLMQMNDHFTREECLKLAKSFDASDSATAVFCPETGFCGFNLHPEDTSELKSLYGKTCTTFASRFARCQELETRLEDAGSS